MADNNFQFDSTPLVTGAGLKPIQPRSPVQELVDKTPVLDEFAAFEQAQPDEFAGFEPGPPDEFDAFAQAEPLDFQSPEELIDNDDFNIVQFVKENPDALAGPNGSKLLEAYRQQRIRGITSDVVGKSIEAAPAVGKEFLKGARDLTERLIDAGLQPAVNTVLGLFSDPQTREELKKETKRTQKKAVAEIAAGSEAAAFGFANLVRTGSRKAVTSDEDLAAATPEQLRTDLLDDVEFARQAEGVIAGKGEAAVATGLDADKLAKEGIELDTAAIESISFVDPLTLIGTGGALSLVTKAGRVVAKVKTVQQATRLAGKLGTKLANAKPIAKLAGGSVKLTGKLATATGRGVEKVGQKLRTPAKVIGGAAGVIKGAELGGIAGAAAGAGFGASGGQAITKGIEAVGRGIQKLGDKTVAFGRQVTGDIPKGRFLKTVGVAKQVAGPTALGATIGGLAAAPLAIAVDTDEEAAQLIAGGIALGGGAGAGLTAAKGFVGLRERVVGQRLLDPFAKDQAPVVRESPDYGLDTNLDAMHRNEFAGLDPESQAVVNEFRELFKGEGEIYLQNPEQYAQRIAEIMETEKGAPLNANELAAAQDFANTHAVFSQEFNTAQGPRKVVFLNKDTTGLPHDSGHLFEATLPEPTRQALRDEIAARYSAEELGSFKRLYEDALNKDRPADAPRRTLSDEAVVGEILAENFSALFNNVDVSTIGTPRPVMDRMIQSAAAFAEKAGIDLSGGRVTPNLDARQSISVQRMMENLVREKVAGRGIPDPQAAPAPRVDFGTPEGVQPGVQNKRVTPTEQAGTAAAAPDSAGIQTARAFAENEGNAVLTKVVEDISASFERKRGEVTPLEFEVLGAKELEPGKVTDRQRRLEERLAADFAEAAGTAPEDVRQLFQAVQVPVRFETVGRGRNQKLQLLGMSLDKVMANVGQIAKAATERGFERILPYDISNGALTPEAWRRFQKDLVSYTENQQNGFRGDGRKLTRPEESLGASIPPENPNFNPTVLPEEVGNFMNLIQGIAPPRTARVTGKGVPGNIKARTIAELNLREVETPAQIRKRDEGKQTFPTGETIGEVNPLRNQVAEQGFDIRNLHEVTERFRVDRIKNVKPRSELQFRAPQTDVVRAGFLPGRRLPDGGDTVRLFRGQEGSGAVAGAFYTTNPTKAASFAPDGRVFEVEVPVSEALAAKRAAESIGQGGDTFFLKRSDLKAKEVTNVETPVFDLDAPVEAQFLPESGRKPRTGREFDDFFTKVSAGRFGASDIPFKPEIALPDHVDFITSKESHTGNFDNHIQKSIPTFYEAQIAKGKAIVDSLPEGGRVLDIAASEGSFGKAVTEQSGGKVETVSLDPNQQMKSFFEEKSQVEGASYDDRAFLNGFEDGDRTVPAFDSAEKFDVVNESMGFQFIDGDRAPQVAEVKRLLKEDGVFFTEEKVKNANWDANEALKDSEFKTKYFDDAALKAKEKVVGFKQSKNEQQAVGMVDNMATQAGLESVLKENFAHVVQYWDSGNFKGYAASDNRASLQRYVDNMADLNSKFTTEATPRNVEKPAASFLPEIAEDLVSEVSRMAPTEFIQAMNEADGGLTGLAVRTGKKFNKPEQVEILSTLEQLAKDEMRTALQEGRMDDAMILASKPQFFREARESATNTGSIGAARERGAKFQPKTESGKRLADEFEFARGVGISNEEKTIGLFTKSGDQEIAQIIYALPEEGAQAEILSITVEPEFGRRGIGEALMREAFADAQAAGLTEAISSPGIVDPRAVSIREKIAPGRNEFKSFTGEIFPDAEAAKKALTRKEAILAEEAIIDAKTDIRDIQFLPKKKSEKKLPLPPKAFLDPDGEFVKVTDNTHDDFLISNADKFNKKFGTKIPKKQGKADVRVGALNKGFVRIAYEPNSGRITYEANAKTFSKKQGDKIFEHVADNLDSIDNITVSLLDDKGGVKKTASRQLFLLDDDGAKLDSIPFVTDDGRPQNTRLTPFFLPKNPELAKRRVVEAAVRLNNGDIFTGRSHFEAVLSMDERLQSLVGEDNMGFIDASGEFLTRQQAFDRALELKQAERKELAFSEDFGGLESIEFRKAAKFLPEDASTKKAEPTIEDLNVVGPEFLLKKRTADQLDFDVDTRPVSNAPRVLGKKERSQLNRKQLREAFPEAMVPRSKNDKIPYDITKSPLFKKHRIEKARIDAFADLVEAKFKEHAADPDTQLGLKWYDDFTPLLKRRYGEDAGIMAELLAATSPNTTPRVNFGFAEAAFKRWKNGDFDGLISKFEEGLKLLNEDKLLAKYEAAVPPAQRPAKVSEATQLGWWIKEHDLIPRQLERITKDGTIAPKFGMHSEAVLKVITRRWLNDNRGPKTNNFVRNLLGTSEEATIDLWAARTMREAGFQGFQDRWRILPENAQAVTNPDFFFSQKVFKEAARRLGLKAHQLQGALWFIEKKRWAEKGWVELDLGDYRTELLRVEGAETPAVNIPDPQGDLF